MKQNIHVYDVNFIYSGFKYLLWKNCYAFTRNIIDYALCFLFSPPINPITCLLLTNWGGGGLPSFLFSFAEDESAVVQGVVTEDGLFDGSVVTRFEEYYIEPTSRYLNKNEDTSPPYHTIAYRTSDVTTPPHPLPCASHQLHREGTLRDSIDRWELLTRLFLSKYWCKHRACDQRRCGLTTTT